MSTKKTTHKKNDNSAFFGGPNPSNANNKKPKFTLTYVYLIVAAALLAYWFFTAETPATEVDNSRFNKMVMAKDIDKLEYVKKNDRVNIYLKEDAIKTKSDYENLRKQNNLTGPQFYIVTTDYQVFNENLKAIQERAINNALASDSTLNRSQIEQEYEISTTEDNSKSWGFEIFFWILPTMLLLFLFFYSTRSMRGGAGGGGGVRRPGHDADTCHQLGRSGRTSRRHGGREEGSLAPQGGVRLAEEPPLLGGARGGQLRNEGLQFCGDK